MMDNYQVLEQIGVTAGGTLHLARHLHNGSTALLKLPELPASLSAAEGLRHEYALLQSVGVAEILKPIALIEEGARLALVLEAFTGASLDTVLARQARLPLPAALAIACQLARALAALHTAGIVHHDLRPANILLSPDSAQVKLADLSRATAREGAAGIRPVAADWAYASPEQSGRMNRHADFRTDFYSLGVTLYRLLTGQLPFEANDTLEWMHCHLARMPAPPRQVVPELPRVVSDLVEKLLAKVPEARYQSASGLLADLEQCLAQWQAAGEIAPFALGTRDVSDRFHIPPKLYGRERERAALLGAFETVSTTGAPMLFTVAGYSGVGKSALISELQQAIVKSGGYFTSGKFDQYQSNFPYATLAQAFERLVGQLLGETEARIAQWRDSLREALEPNGQLMVTLIPRLELILGAQPPVPDLPPQEAHGRFQMVFRHFLGVFARAEHPLVLLLDDLQWVDAATLALLGHLTTHPDVRHLLLVGAYRDNEVDAGHPLLSSMEAIRQAGGAVQGIVLAPLPIDELAQLVADALHCPPAEARPLAQLVLDKTAGNPFFTRQFLAALAEEQLLTFNPGQGKWVWNLPRIHAKGYTDNVVDLMVDKLTRLPPETQDALAQFACLGNATDATTLGLILEQAAQAVHTVLWDAERAGLICRQEAVYTFLHDRVQEAAYSRIPQDVRLGMHLRIGRILASRLSPEAIADRIFEVVNQLNGGIELVESADERERIAELNLLAGRRAKSATAYASALNYLGTGAALLEADCWERRHDLAFGLDFHRAECEYLSGQPALAEQRLSALSERAADTVERASVVCLRMDLYTTLGQSQRAIAVCLDYLRALDMACPPAPTDAETRREYERIWARLGDRTIEDLIDLPLMDDPASFATIDVLAKVLPPALFTNANLASLTICKAVTLSIEHGNCDASCFAYVMLGRIAGRHFGDYQAGFCFGQLGYDLIEGRGLKRFEASTMHCFAVFVMRWMKHVRACHDLMRRAFDAANRIGDLMYAAYTCNNLNSNLLFAGDPLPEVQHEVERGLAFAEKARFGLVADIIATQRALIRMLRKLTPVFGCLGDSQADEAAIERRLSGNPMLAIAACWHWIRKLQARYIAGDYEAALDAASRAQALLWTSEAFLEEAEYHFYGALARAASYDTADVDERPQHRAGLATHHRQLAVWAANCPENFENRALLAAAEIARIDGRDLDAIHLYEQAICSARDNGFPHNEAIAHELAARFYLARKLPTSGHAHLERACSCHARWGAHGKVKQLEEQYPQLRARTRRMAATPADSEARLSEARPSAARLDLLSIAKASQAISGRIVLDELIDSLMRIMLESAGAQSACLLLVQGGELALAAAATVEQQAVQVRRHAGQAMPQGQLPLSMLQYVRRLREPVLLMDAGAPHPFAGDPYFAQQHPQSVLCLPILRQSALTGLLYLENRLTTHAFTPDRVEVLELLASQAAISLDNARLYTDVRDSHARIRRLVESSIIGIFFWDLSGNILDANEAFLAMVGYTRQNLLAGEVNWESMTLPEYKALDERKAQEVRTTRTCTPYEKEFLSKDGCRIPVLVGAVLFDDSPDHGVAFVLDLSERKRAEAEREARHAAEAANRAKSVFLASMSHELRTPLNGILGYAQILERDRELGQQQLAGVSVIRRSGEHLLTLINDILDLAKIEAGKLRLYPVDFPLMPFIQDIAGIVGVKAAQKDLELVCEIAPAVPRAILADEKRLRQVLLNLLSNAVKFTDYGRVTLRVGWAAPARLCCEIQDTGIGIPAHQLQTIFEPFEQGGSTRQHLAGTGLGLAISRQFVHLMGGEIEVKSRPGQGSTFRFEVEAQPVQASTALEASKSVSGYAGPRKTVLVVDDIAENRAVVIGLLEPLGFGMAEAANGREALALARRLRPDLILMDITMPELDGLEATRRLRRQPALRDVPVLALSASVSASDSEQCIAAGMNAFLPKPLDANKLFEQIAILLRLEWTYGPAQPETPAQEEALVLPPDHEMEILYRLARLGNMHDIVAEAERLESLDERYRSFAQRLMSLARNYQSQAVLRLVEEHLSR